MYSHNNESLPHSVMKMYSAQQNFKNQSKSNCIINKLHRFMLRMPPMVCQGFSSAQILWYRLIYEYFAQCDVTFIMIVKAAIVKCKLPSLVSNQGMGAQL